MKVQQRKLRFSVDPRSPHTYICEHHKQIIQSVRSGKRKKKDEDNNEDELNDFGNYPYETTSMSTISDFRSNETNNIIPSMKSYSMFDIDFTILQVNALRRYKRHFRFSSKPGLNKNQLAEV